MTPKEIQNALETLGNMFKTSQFNEAKDFAFELLEHQSIQEDTISKAMIFNDIGNIFNQISEFPLAIEYYTKALLINEEIGNLGRIAIILGNIGSVYSNLSDYSKALEYFEKKLQINEELGNKDGIARIFVNIGNVYSNLSDYTKALEYYWKSFHIIEEIGDKGLIATILGNIGVVYINLSDFSNALEYYSKSLQIDEELGNKFGLAINLGNIGIVYLNLSDYQKALEYLVKALQIHEEIGNKVGIANTLGNIGNAYNKLSDYSKALEYHLKALKVNEEIENKRGIAINLCNIGTVYSTQHSTIFDSVQAEEFLQRTLSIAEEIGTKDLIKSVYEHLFSLRFYEQNFEVALQYQTKAITLEREIQSESINKQAQQYDQRRKIEEDERARQLKLARFQEQERIFHNILPITIANRLIDGEQTIAESFENVSIFFSDIVGFTTLSENIAPDKLVKGLNSIFTTFDRIATKYGLEKIKTIGDAYMAVCGVPESFEDHSYRAAKFAIEANEILPSLQLGDDFKHLKIRIGLHCGSVVAGIIGEKKFAYDVWGDAVNVASRMESNSESSRIHISENFAKSIENYSEFSLIPRGEISVKGKGTMNTYWLEKAR